jgi:hypothetical protein
MGYMSNLEVSKPYHIWIVRVIHFVHHQLPSLVFSLFVFLSLLYPYNLWRERRYKKN